MFNRKHINAFTIAEKHISHYATNESTSTVIKQIDFCNGFCPSSEKKI